MMGIWWMKSQDNIPSKVVKNKNDLINPVTYHVRDEVVFFEGHPYALSKKWPFLWRYGQIWHILKVPEREMVFPFHIFCHDPWRVIRTRKIIDSRYIGVRVGPKPVSFWARTGRENKLIPLEDTGAAYQTRLSATGVSNDQRRLFHAYQSMTTFI
jgi:hypothetical protein